MNKPALIAAAALSLAAAPALAETRTFDFPPFEGIDVATGLTAVVTRGDKQSVYAEASSAAVLDRLDLKVRKGKLYAKHHTDLIDVILSGGILNMLNNKNDVTIYITVPELTGISASSGANVEADFLAGRHPYVGASSGAEITVSNLDVLKLDLSTSSGAGITASGNCDELEMHFSSGAHIRAKDLSCEVVDISGSSGASADVTAENAVTGGISSGASLRLSGDPEKIDVESSSGGSVRIR